MVQLIWRQYTTVPLSNVVRPRRLATLIDNTTAFWRPEDLTTNVRLVALKEVRNGPRDVSLSTPRKHGAS